MNTLMLYNLPEDQEELDDFDPNKFVCKNGAEAVKELLRRVDVEEDISRLRIQLYEETSVQKNNTNPDKKIKGT